MGVSVNGINYERWEDVPADLRALLPARIFDTNGDGIPDLIAGADSTTITIQSASGANASELPRWASDLVARAGLTDPEADAPHQPPRPQHSPAVHDARHAKPGTVILNGSSVNLSDNALTPSKKWWQFWRP